MNKLRLFEAFAGYGSQALALGEVTDFITVGISELESNDIAIKTYKALHGQVNNFGDITKIDPNILPDMDIFTYSFPCQDLSKNGSMKGFDGERSSLLYECEKIIKTKKPKYLLMENVATLVSKRFIKDFNKWLDLLSSYGYNTSWIKSKALSYGVPQNRERVFAVSFLNDNLDLKVPNIQYPNVFDYIKDIKFRKKFQSPLIYQKDGEWRVKEAVKCGYSVINNLDIINYAFPTSETRRGRVGRGYAQTLLTSNTQGIFSNGYIYDLTGYHALRLMGLNKEELTKIHSLGLTDKELHFLAGNSIVKDVLVDIFRQIVNHHNKVD